MPPCASFPLPTFDSHDLPPDNCLIREYVIGRRPSATGEYVPQELILAKNTPVSPLFYPHLAQTRLHRYRIPSIISLDAAESTGNVSK